MNKNIALAEVDEINISIIMDNSIDALLVGSQEVQRFDFSAQQLIAEDGFSAIVAEHGFSAKLEMKCGTNQGAVLYDTGISPDGTRHNMEALGIDINQMQAIVLSHSHMDHTGGLPALLDKMSTPPIPLVVHPDALLERKLVRPDGYEEETTAPRLTEQQLSKVHLQKHTEPTLLADNMLLVSGEIERTTAFETGFPLNYTKYGGQWQHDPLIKDDQCVIVRLRGKGLVVVSGCCHAGVVNTVHYAQKLTGCDQVYAVLGGFHLTGNIFDKIIPDTLDALREINPKYLIPGHCTGWSAINQIIQTMPEKYIPSCVGTTFCFKGE
ncbi:MAG: hypothetical protein CENE_00718 [Candidatus Celerinatantimonas neptuna]|nr:MAG: hypothetical protein CENE_00718 [Candidatus Celerinatantimonas neptuna]